jgi:hypothetical protein
MFFKVRGLHCLHRVDVFSVRSERKRLLAGGGAVRDFFKGRRSFSFESAELSVKNQSLINAIFVSFESAELSVKPIRV